MRISDWSSDVCSSDLNALSVWRDGNLVGLVKLDGDIEASGTKLDAPPSLLPLVCDFLSWQPNNNGRIRRFLPLDTDIALTSDRELQAIVDRLNQTPHEVLGAQIALLKTG